jgi:MFS family permease
MEMLVLSWLVLLATDSPFQVGLVLVFINVPRPFFSLFTGFIADRFSRHRILVVAQSIIVLTTASLLYLIISGLVQPWHVFIVAFGLGVSKSLEDPSRRTAIMDIVGERRLVNAISLDVISNTAGKMIGPVLGGILLDTSGFTGAYSFLLALQVTNLALLVTRVKIPRVKRQTVREAVFRSLGAAVNYAAHSPTIQGLLYVTVVMNAMSFPARQFIPVIGRDHLHVGATLVGLLLAAEAIGQFAGAGVMAFTRNFQYLGRVYIFGSLGALTMVLLFAWSPWYALAFILLALGGIGQAGFSTMQNTIPLLVAPAEMRGRMLGLLSVCIGVGTPLGTLEMGAIATVSTKWAISGNAIVGLLLILPVALASPLIRQPITPPAPPVPVSSRDSLDRSTD